jgi:hypothetical protein
MLLIIRAFLLCFFIRPADFGPTTWFFLFSVEDALEYQATWAAFALQSKVHWVLSSSEQYGGDYLRAFFCRILASLQVLLRESRRFCMTT